MIPMDQTLFLDENGKDIGNCYIACMASLLERPIGAIPNFVDDYEDWEWFDRCRRWCREELGMDILAIDFNASSPDFKLHGFWIAVGETEFSECNHAVIYYDDNMVHDPHPRKGGISRLKYGHTFIALDPVKYRNANSVPPKRRETPVSDTGV